MPELPEVESLRRSLLPHLLGAIVTRAHLLRPDFAQPRGQRRKHLPFSAPPEALLQGATITDLLRVGKHLALITQLSGMPGPALEIHLGMSGSILIEPVDLAHRAANDPSEHLHIWWQLQPPSPHTAPIAMTFRDPRRFGGVLPFPSAEALTAAWNQSLGPDALSIDDDHLYRALRQDRTARRPIKAALLDQRILAGVGNIYADEALFRAGIRPSANTARLSAQRLANLTRHIRDILQEAIAAGGSSLRDYADAMNNPGAFVHRHQVYGRQGLPCTLCQTPLKSTALAQRTTVYCPQCQRT